jgi:hypothetical protein
VIRETAVRERVGLTDKLAASIVDAPTRKPVPLSMVGALARSKVIEDRKRKSGPRGWSATDYPRSFAKQIHDDGEVNPACEVKRIWPSDRMED